jgi:tripartite-type tricarboxylate transporter receptor subunit TctC
MYLTMRSILFPVVLLLANTAWAQEYPGKPVRMVAPSSPGGAIDILARLVSLKLAETWGRSVFVENRPGATANIGAELVARSAPDGYTLLLAGLPNAINMSLYRNSGYDLAKDLAPITGVARFPSLIAVHPSVPVKSVNELIALAKRRPGELNYGSAGSGSPNHLSMEIFKSMAKVSIVHVPYKGTGPMLIDLIAGQVQLASMGLPPALPYVKAGRLRVIAVTGKTRSPFLPEVPTVSESGLAGFEVFSWYGVFAPAGLPAPLVRKLNTDIVGFLEMGSVKERLAALDAEPMPMSPDEFGRYVHAEIAKWAKVINETGVKAD